MAQFEPIIAFPRMQIRLLHYRLTIWKKKKKKIKHDGQGKYELATQFPWH